MSPFVQDEPLSHWQMLDHVADSSANHEAVLKGLEPKTWYKLAVNGYTMKGDGSRSRLQTVETPEAKPTPPRKLTLHLLNVDPVTVQVCALTRHARL